MEPVLDVMDWELSNFLMKQLIQDDDVSIANGAIKGWTRRNRFYYYQLRCLSNHFDFTLTTKWKDYPQKIKDIILWVQKKKLIFLIDLEVEVE